MRCLLMPITVSTVFRPHLLSPMYAGSGFAMLGQPRIMHILLPSVFIGGSNHVLHVADFTTLD